DRSPRRGEDAWEPEQVCARAHRETSATRRRCHPGLSPSLYSRIDGTSHTSMRTVTRSAPGWRVSTAEAHEETSVRRSSSSSNQKSEIRLARRSLISAFSSCFSRSVNTLPALSTPSKLTRYWSSTLGAKKL